MIVYPALGTIAPHHCAVPLSNPAGSYTACGYARLMSHSTATTTDSRPQADPVETAIDNTTKARAPKRSTRDRSPTAEAEDRPGATRYILVVYQGHHGRFGQIDRALFRELRRLVSETITTPKDETEIDLWLESGGGDAHAAYKIALLLRARARTLRIVVPDYAKSAATLLSLAADELFMGDAAELGPLDAQVGYEKQGVTISALDMARSLDDLAQTSMMIVLTGGAALLEDWEMSRADSLSSMVDFATKFMTPVMDKLDPMMIHWSSSLLDVAVHYADRLLAMRTPTAASGALVGLPNRLMQGYPAHGFVISRAEARRLGLPVVDLQDYVYGEQVEALFPEMWDRHVNVVQFVDAEQVGVSDSEEDDS